MKKNILWQRENTLKLFLFYEILYTKNIMVNLGVRDHVTPGNIL